MPWIYLIILFIIKQQFNDVDKRAQIWYAMAWIYLIILFIIKQQFNDVDKRARIWYAMGLFDYFIPHQTTIQSCRQAGPDMICHGFIWLFYSSSNNNSIM